MTQNVSSIVLRTSETSCLASLLATETESLQHESNFDQNSKQNLRVCKGEVLQKETFIIVPKTFALTRPALSQTTRVAVCENLWVCVMLQTTRADREWVINPMDIDPWWLILVGVIPALLATILIFLDQQITAVIVNRPDHKMQVPEYIKDMHVFLTA